MTLYRLKESYEFTKLYTSKLAKHNRNLLYEAQPSSRN